MKWNQVEKGLWELQVNREYLIIIRREVLGFGWVLYENESIQEASGRPKTLEQAQNDSFNAFFKLRRWSKIKKKGWMLQVSISCTANIRYDGDLSVYRWSLYENETRLAVGEESSWSRADSALKGFQDSQE